jgi:hypothetical protein
MGATTSELKQEVQERRSDIGRDLDALGEKMSPGRALDRRKAATRRRLTNVRETVMGAASDMTDNLAAVPERATERVQGNPLAVGLIAFGGGLLLASVLPKSHTEEQLAASAAEPVRQVASEFRDASQHVVADLRDSVGEAASHVKDAASDSASNLAGAAEDAAGQVRESNRRA